MKVVSGETMQAMDRRTIEEFGISGLTLMENAGRAAADVVVAEFGSSSGLRVVVVAGKGNNGGDGYVIARLLREKGWQVTTFVIAADEEVCGDARVNLELIRDGSIRFCPEAGGLDCYRSVFDDADVIVDALLGTGLKSKVRGSLADAVALINAAGKPVVSVDIPSGIDAGTGKILGSAVKADITVSFAAAKLGQVLFPGCEQTGKLFVIDIGIPEEVSIGVDFYEFLDLEAIRPLVRKRDRSAHKGEFGHCLIVAGSTGKTGAAAMAANSAVRTGAGLVTLAVPQTLNHILEIKTTEAMTLPLPDDGTGCLSARARVVIEKALVGKNALALGPGISWSPETACLVRELTAETLMPMVVDADGLNALSEDSSFLLRKKSPAVILTPHPGEMARLTGLTVGEV